MRRTLLTYLLIMCFGILAHAQHYSIHSATTGAKVETGGKTVDATKGLPVKSADVVVIPQGGSVEIYNSLDKRIYKSLRPGKITVTRMIIEAREVATDNSASVASRVNLARSGAASNRNVYHEKGMVTRALETYDPDAVDKEMNTDSLAQFVLQSMGSAPATDKLPLPITHGPTGDSGLFFRVENNLEAPVYFNVLRIGAKDKTAEISQLGQPEGSYVLLPQQAIRRDNMGNLNPAYSHILILTPYRFDINQLITKINELTAAGSTSKADENMPAYVIQL